MGWEGYWSWAGQQPGLPNSCLQTPATKPQKYHKTWGLHRQAVQYSVTSVTMLSKYFKAFFLLTCLHFQAVPNKSFSFVRNLSSAVLLRWSCIPDRFHDRPVYLDNPFILLVEFLSLNLPEGNVCLSAAVLLVWVGALPASWFSDNYHDNTKWQDHRWSWVLAVQISVLGLKSQGWS